MVIVAPRTIAEIRAKLKARIAEWTVDPRNELYRGIAGRELADLWNAAMRIPDAPAAPDMPDVPWGITERPKDTSAAVKAANILVRWCDEAERPAAPGEPPGVAVAAVPEPQATDEQAGPWSRPKGPREWAKVFGFSPDTFKRRCEAGAIRNKKLSCRKYLVHLDDVPTLQAKSAQVSTSQHK